MRTVSILIAIVFCIRMSGQNNFWKEVPDVLKKMEDTKRYSVIINYAMYLDGNFFKPYQTKSLELNRDGDKVNMKQEGVFEVIETQKASLNVSHRDKHIYYVKQQEKDPAKEQADRFDIGDMYQLFVLNADKITEYVSDIHLLKENSGVNEYEVAFKVGEYSKITIAVDNSKKELKYMMVHYREKKMINRDSERSHELCMKVEYKNYKINPVFDPLKFSVSRFVHTNTETHKTELNSSINHYKLIVY